MNYKKAEAKAWARERLKGHWSSLMSPFTPDDKIDAEGLIRNIEYVQKLGTSGIGFTWLGGEFWALTLEERKQICETAVRASGGKTLVGIHTTDVCLSNCIELTKHAEENGADLVIVAPSYVAKSDEQVYQFVEKLAEKVDIGIGILNSPFMGMLLSAQGVAKLTEIPNVCVIKEASYPVNPYLTFEISRLCGDKIVVSSPYEEIYFNQQFIDFHQQVLFANPQDWMFDKPGRNYFVQFIDLASEGHMEEAARIYKEKVLETRKILDRHWGYMKRKYNGSFPAQIFKVWGELVGLAAGHVRPPLIPMTEAEISLLREDLRRIGQLSVANIEVKARR